MHRNCNESTSQLQRKYFAPRNKLLCSYTCCVTSALDSNVGAELRIKLAAPQLRGASRTHTPCWPADLNPLGPSTRRLDHSSSKAYRNRPTFDIVFEKSSKCLLVTRLTGTTSDLYLSDSTISKLWVSGYDPVRRTPWCNQDTHTSLWLKWAGPNGHPTPNLSLFGTQVTNTWLYA